MQTNRLLPVLLRLTAVALVCGGTAELRAETPSAGAAIRHSDIAAPGEISATTAQNPASTTTFTSTTVSVENAAATITNTTTTSIRETDVVTDQSSTTLLRQPRRREHLAGRHRAQHTFFANAGYTTVLTAFYLAQSTSGSLNEGFEFSAGYNWTSRRGFGAGIVYSGGFFSAERDGIERTSRLHYLAPEFVARQRVGRRWLFRESAGIGFGHYIRTYGDSRGGNSGVGIHESVSAEYMLTRHFGLSAGFGGQWLIVGSPDVDDGWELNIGGIFRFQFVAGVRLYF